MKPVVFLGDSRDRVREFPAAARTRAGLELYAVQLGQDPTDWKPMASVGAGVREIRIRDASGAFRILYVAQLTDCVLVLHAFQKRSQKTPDHDLELARRRLKTWMEAHHGR